MSRLHLIHDLSPSRPWLFATVHANREMLLAHDIELGPFLPWSCELVPSHLPFWDVIPEDGAVPAHISTMLSELAAQLESGHDALLLSGAFSIPAHQSFERLWQQHAALAQHDVRVLFILGRPACMLEQCYREEPSLLPESTGLTLINYYELLPALVKHARQQWGNNNVSLLANVSASPAAQPQDDVAQGLFEFLACPNPLPLRHLPRHPLCMASLTARRLVLTPEVRHNAWPHLDEGLFMNSLSALDCQWSTEPVSPKKIRDILIQNGQAATRELEELLALEAGALACPDWLAEQPEAELGAPLSDDRLQSFVEALPSEVREPLRQRLANDAPLLSPDQKTLSQALASIKPDGYTVMGEPILPVELTVLTMAYNHEAYIAECMDSVLAQQTSFPVRHIVLDHHSTDATPDIVAAYAARYPSIQPVLLSHRRPTENVMGLFLRCRTQYAALCDGD
ncbi:MAG: glycosyltransferase family A protein, partial [Desulfovibrio sp.]|nr:glycosyltransferase family A protein [Desulfovibrio sp.]